LEIHKVGDFLYQIGQSSSSGEEKLMKGIAESSTSCDDHRGRLALWDVQVLGKIKIHMWRLVENGLAFGTELSPRRIKDGVFCLACGRTEDLVHRFWTCPHFVSAWTYLADLTGFVAQTLSKRLSCHSELKGWFLDWIGKAQADKLSWFFMMTSGMPVRCYGLSLLCFFYHHRIRVYVIGFFRKINNN
jgi:hypothetical protein